MVITIFGRQTEIAMLPMPITMRTGHVAHPAPRPGTATSRSAFRLRSSLAAGLSVRVAAL
ncbi:MAG: hypothetical protein NTZ11_06950 [Gammaproteobacteria bacterium]|nr:hypothetical protein [Gammaproteobacteria bacterium]